MCFSAFKSASKPMERKENQPMSEGICRRLFNFIINGIAARALKRVTLGQPTLHGATQKPVEQNGGVLTKLIDEERVEVPSHETLKNGMDSMIFIEVEQINGFKDYSHSPVEGDNENLMQKDLNVPLSLPKTVPVEDQGSKNKINGSKDNVKESIGITTSISQVRDSNMVSEPMKPRKIGAEKVLGSPVSKKTVSIKDGAEDKDSSVKKKDKNVMREKLTLAIEPETDVNPNAPRTLRPILKAASNINEKSDAFIRRRKEAIRKSLSTNDPRTS